MLAVGNPAVDNLTPRRRRLSSETQVENSGSGFIYIYQSALINSLNKNYSSLGDYIQVLYCRAGTGTVFLVLLYYTICLVQQYYRVLYALQL